ncbi:AAT family amino acid transporter [Hypoxylon trugodes]|uniref:AAT family amino acid transporter n=1 Tax=Hypoxylon trugodes TaxID=326681 RepID=UPI0021997663|nr:AAT family amino acid transporter [Hypoxylon trugodes]KAI1391584.1 AAT family amino acid transporter [Hypoxylon trugodes]
MGDIESKTDSPDKRSLNMVASTMEGQTERAEPEGISGTKRGLKSRHVQMIGLGGTIGTGLFIGTGQGLRMGGPVGLFAAYTFMSIVVFGIITGTSEMSSYLPVAGSSISYYARRFMSPSLSFALGWLYCYIWTIAVPSEITAAGLVVQYWNPPVHPAVWTAIFIAVIICLNFTPVKVYGETEFWFASFKILGIVGLLFMAVILVAGGGPNHHILGFQYWTNPGPVNEYLVPGAAGQLVAIISATTFSVYAFAYAPELLVVTSGEMKNPRTNLPKAGKRYIYRLIIFYILGSFFIGLIIPSNDPELLGGSSGAGASPWALAAKNAGIRGLDSVINFVILTSAVSAGNSSLYLSSRTLYSMALTGAAPKIFLRCTSNGIPYVALAFTSLFSSLAFLNLSSSGADIFTWLVNFLNSGAFIGWICCALLYLRFRKATFVQNVHELPYRSIFQPYMSWFCASVLTLLLLLNGLSTFLPGQWNTQDFISAYIGIPVFLAFYLGHKFTVGRRDPWLISPHDVDLHTGLEDIIANEKPVPQRKGWKHFGDSLFN